MRIHGVDNIAPQPLVSHDAVNGKILTTQQIRTRAARRALAVRGMMEAVTWSFIPDRHAKLFGGGEANLKLSNPIAADMTSMRPSLLPGLLAAAQRNADKGIADVALFEVSGTYEGDTPDSQRRVAAGVRRGTARLEGAGRHWAGNADNVGVFDAKADAFAVLEAAGAAGRQAAGRGRRSGLVSSGPFGNHQARAEDRARALRRVPSEDAGRARRFRRAGRLRSLSRRHPRAEAEADAHQAEARPVAVPGGAGATSPSWSTSGSRPAR